MESSPRPSHTAYTIYPEWDKLPNDGKFRETGEGAERTNVLQDFISAFFSSKLLSPTRKFFIFYTSSSLNPELLILQHLSGPIIAGSMEFYGDYKT